MTVMTDQSFVIIATSRHNDPLALSRAKTKLPNIRPEFDVETARQRRDMAQAQLTARYEHLLQIISSQRFLQKHGIGNEVPFFICPYHPQQHVEMEALRKQLVSKLSQQGIVVLDVNLYDLCLDLLRARNIWERLIQAEPNRSKSDLQELLRNVLDPEKHLIPEIGTRIQQVPFQVLFLSGVGEVFPYIRSHTILNNLQSTAKDQPTVMFFPGEYVHTAETGASLELFGRLHDDKYYRAFNILHYSV